MSEDAPKGTTYNLLFVCTGNTCRSPLAEAIARRELAARGWSHVRVRSAGTMAVAGGPASVEAVEVARDAGLDLDGHGSRPLSGELVEWADLVLVMGASHREAARALGGATKTDLLGSFAAGGASPVAVPDPFGGQTEEYRRTLEELKGLVVSALDRLAPIVAP